MKTNLETFMYEYIKENVIDEKLQEMLIYSIKSGGKRFRPLLFLSLFENNQGLNYLHVAAAIEFCHNYSLVHDDMPCMDNDRYRRGNLSCWAKYGEDEALLIGDALCSESMMLVLKSNLPAQMCVTLMHEFIDKSGVNGMILGQHLDITNQANTQSKMKHMYAHKTAKLIELCFSSYAIIKGYDKVKYTQLGYNLGILFQYQDDMLELSENQLEKNDADLRNNKDTVLTVFENYKNEIKIMKTKINQLLDQLNINYEAKEIINKIVTRDEENNDVK